MNFPGCFTHFSREHTSDTKNSFKPQYLVLPQYHLLYPASQMQNTCVPFDSFVIGHYTPASRAPFLLMMITRFTQLQLIGGNIAISHNNHTQGRKSRKGLFITYSSSQPKFELWSAKGGSGTLLSHLVSPGFQEEQLTVPAPCRWALWSREMQQTPRDGSGLKHCT